MEQREIRCPEYSFKVAVNPWQHPEFDKNIHHLFALTTALCNTCGGMIFLIADDAEQHITRKIIDRFQSRLIEAILHRTENLPQNLINFTQVPLWLTTQGVWAAIYLKKSKLIQPWSAGKYSKPYGIHTTLHGFVHIEETLPQKGHVTQSPETPVFSTDTIAAIEDSDNALPSDSNGAETESTLSTPGNNGLATLPSSDDEVDFARFNRLEWSKNKKDWQSYVHGETRTIDTIVNSCSLWKPTKPMTVTPDPAVLTRQRWFASVKDMVNTLSAVDTKEPGFAVVCKTWKFHISNSEIEPRPPAHICDILTVSNYGRVCLWVICSDHDEQTVSYQMEYLLTTGRMIKYRLIQEEGDSDLSNLCIECRLFYPSTVAQRYGTVSSAVRESLEMQNHVWVICNDRVKFESLQRALALVILSKETPLKRPVGSQTAITLSVQQLEVLHNKDRVNYVSGPAGSGKSYTAALLCQMYGRDNSVYLCTTREFAEYLNFSGYKGTLVQRDQDLLKEIKVGTFRNKTCIIIDDSHNFSCTKSSMKNLFKLMNDNKAMSLYVFADNDYQSFDTKRKQAMRNCIRELSLEVLGREPYYAYLTVIYRNTKKIISFVQSAIQDSYEDYQKIECHNVETGEGIECIVMTNIWLHSPENDLVNYLRNVPVDDTYKLTEIAILLDPTYTSDQIEECRNILREHMPKSSVQSASVFPQRGVVVDSVGSFLGLDAPLCVFILPSIYAPHKRKSPFLERLIRRDYTETAASICNPCFKVFMASRATHKAVFVVPRIDADIVKELKFDLFEVSGRLTRILG